MKHIEECKKCPKFVEFTSSGVICQKEECKAHFPAISLNKEIYLECDESSDKILR